MGYVRRYTEDCESIRVDSAGEGFRELPKPVSGKVWERNQKNYNRLYIGQIMLGKELGGVMVIQI